MPLAHFSVTVFAIRALAIANGQLGIADGINCPAMWAVKTIAMAEFPSSMAEFPSSMHCGVHHKLVPRNRIAAPRAIPDTMKSRSAASRPNTRRS